MPLFRRHCGGLEISLSTTIIVKNMDELKKSIKEHWANFLDIPDLKSNFNDFEVKVFIPYELDLAKSFDKRCGWYTHYVSADVCEKGKFCMEGYLSEPM